MAILGIKQRKQQWDAWIAPGSMVANHQSYGEAHGKRLALRRAVMKLFCDPLSECSLRLAMLRPSEWKNLLHWLDVSGLSLYFLDRVLELQISSMLPTAVLERLQQNLQDNTRRMQDLLEEFAFIHREFQRIGLSYVTVKGFALWPDSVSKPELRSQLDLDFILSPDSAVHARRLLEARGYHLHAASGKSWEFKANQIAGVSLRDMYKPTAYRCVELHIEEDCAGTRLDRRIVRSVHGVEAPVLDAGDQFIDQGMHLYKHITRDFFRLSHLLEFRRHVESRKEDQAFWGRVRVDAIKHPIVPVGLGAVTLLASHLQGSFAPEAFSCWTLGSISPSARSWIEQYGNRLAFADFPGTKLGMLLRKELLAGDVTNESAQRSLLPRRLPPPVVKPPEHERLTRRLQRQWFELRYILFRLRFHCVEGLRYLVESACWKRYKKRATQAVTPGC